VDFFFFGEDGGGGAGGEGVVGRAAVGVGSGVMVVVPIDALDQCGHGDVNLSVAVAVLAEIARFDH
jgi:hypothetical protein